MVISEETDNTSSNSSNSESSDTSGETSGSSTGDGYVKDITGTAEANAENNTFEPEIVNNSELKTLLSLTDAEVAEDINVWLDIQDIGSSVSKTDKTLVQNASDDYTVGMYLDINLFKKVGSNAAVKITETNGKIKASIVIPESLWKSGRTFELIRVHDGGAAVISGTHDESTHVFTFETDKFSTYALAYKDATSSGNNSSIVKRLSRRGKCKRCRKNIHQSQENLRICWMIQLWTQKQTMTWRLSRKMTPMPGIMTLMWI